METIKNTKDPSENDPGQSCRRREVTPHNSMNFLSIRKNFLFTISFLLMLIALPRTGFSQATVTTDKLDYIPGEYVQVSGTGWLLSENVMLVIVEDPVIHPADTLYATADVSGNIFNNEYMIEAHDIGQSFTLTATGSISGFTAQAVFTDGVDFRQSANNDAGYGLGNIHWLNSILQNTNSKYFEGMSSLQRVILTEVGTTSGNVHTLTFSHQAIKSASNAHAYDFLTSWPQAQAAADAIAPGEGLFANINQCGPEPSSDPGGILALCASLHSSGFFATPSIPDAMGTALGDNVATRVAAYESVFGDRTLKVYGNADITSATVTFNGYTGTDLDANYTLTWTSASSSILVEFAGHLGVGEDPLLAGIGYGTGKGSGAIPGGPYHVFLNLLDGHSLGNQDNQIKAADILIPPPVCSVTGPNSACSGASNLIYTGPSGTGLSYAWSFTTANGATFCSATNTQTVCVNAGTGSFTLQLMVTGAGGSTTCQKEVTIFPLPNCVINDPLNSDTLPGITCNSPGGSPNNTISTSNVAAGNTYLWEFLSPPAGWSITGGQGTNQITFTSGACAASVTVQLTITDINGCVSVCTKIITPNPFVSSCDANAGADKHLTCTTTTITLEGSTLTPSSTADDGTVYPSSYSWAGPGIVSGGNTLNPIVNAPGTYILTVTVFPGVGGDVERSCTDTVLVSQDIDQPLCSINGINPACMMLSNDYSGPDAPLGKSYSYSWTLTGAVNASISGSSASQTVTVISGTCSASYTLQLKVTDLANGCFSICSRSFEFADLTSPEIGDPGQNATINCPAEPVFTEPIASDACGAANVVLVKDTTIGNACSYVRTKTWKAVDACGNESNQVSQSITVHDVTDPTIGDPGQNATIDCPSEPVFTAPLAQDECSAVNVVLVKDTTIGNACSYVRTKTWKAVDACGNESNQVSQAITVHDVTDPTIGAPGQNATIDCPAEPVFTAPLAQDECSAVNVVLVKDTTIGNACSYVRTKTWKAVDACGNESNQVSQAITVHDVTDPTIGAPGQNATIDCPAEPVFTVPLAQDECSAVNVVLVKDTTIGNACSYVRTKTWKAVDACGNESNQVSQAITVHDVTDPTIGNPGQNATIDCPAEPVFTAPLAQDECSAVNVVLVKDTTIGNACSYVRTKTWKAVDACGNESNQVSQAITVHDVTDPTIGDPGQNATINCPSEPVFTAPLAQDECSAVNVVLVKDTTIGNACSYVRTKTWKAVDACGNESNQVSQSITVHDVTDPTIGDPGQNATIDCPAIPVFTAPLAQDECSTVNVVLVKDTTIGNNCLYVRTKTWKAVDACTNESGMVSQSITVRDITAPVLSGEGADVTYEDCAASAVFTAPTAQDECDPNPVVNVVSTDTILNPDGSTTYRRVWNAIDACQNTSTEVDQSITIPACSDEFCSLTQGFYGNAKGVACATGERGAVLINRLLGAPYGNLVIGKDGRSLTIDQAHANCITMRLPAGSTATVLPVGNQVFDANCNTTIPIDKKGKFQNVLLGQTITLGLNLRLDGQLGGLILKGTVLTTIGSFPGADGMCGTEDDLPNAGSVVVKTIPQSVLDALANLYGSRSVNNLFDLANRALGGLATGGASLSDINQAVSSINEGFDGCRFLQGFTDESRDVQVESGSITNDKNITLKAIPNPFSESTILEFTSKTDVNALVEVYNVEGAKIATLFNDQVKANETHSITFSGQGFADGIYIYRVTTGNRSYYHKLVLAK